MATHDAELQEPIAWVVSTLRYGPPGDPHLQIRVLCPFCGLIHTHGANMVSDPQLGSRVSHCGDSRPGEEPVGYELAWPDDEGAKLLSADMLICHGTTSTSEYTKQCQAGASVSKGAGFYCARHEWGGTRNQRVEIDTSPIRGSDSQSRFTPDFVTTGKASTPYDRLGE